MEQKAFYRPFKVGDSVRLKEGLKNDQWYGDDTFNTPMIFAGTRILLESDVEGKFFLEGDKNLWYYTPEMLEHAVPEVSKDRDEKLNALLKEKGAILFVWHPENKDVTVSFPRDNYKYKVAGNMSEAIETLVEDAKEMSELAKENHETLNGCFEAFRPEGI